ncbi:MAG TPA: universal stress protein [Dehalococcoidia bacterium]|nr:universal stress protein [Dehalococcoidia bacterium]
MFNKVLVTLDGSPLAESILSWVPVISKAASVQEVTLLTVIEEGTPEQLHQAEGYLKSQADRLKQEATRSGVAAPAMKVMAARSPIVGVASTILKFAEDGGMDLIVLSTHGRSGFDRWSMGSVAEKLLKGSDIPLFLVRSTETASMEPAQLRRFLVPVDGSDLSEHALPHAEQLARSAGAEVTLLYVEAPPEIGADHGPSATAQAQKRKDVLTYLGTLLPVLAQAGIPAKRQIRTGYPAEEIVREVEHGDMDLVIMSSHGRAGIARATLGSVADRVLRTSPVPVMLVPAHVRCQVPAHLQGPLAYYCHHCGRRTYRDSFSPQHHCARCGYLLKACGNCVNFDGTGCALQLPFVSEANPGNRCPQFQFRKTRAPLR